MTDAPKWQGATFHKQGYPSRGVAWVGYSLWAGSQYIEMEDDAGMEITVKIVKEPDHTWTLHAEIRPCSKG